MPSMKVMAQRAGMDTINCGSCGHPVKCAHCGKIQKGANLMARFFRAILDAVRNGEAVSLHGFGNFSGKQLKGRKVISPVLEDGNENFDDVLVLRFRQSKVAKRIINGWDVDTQE